MILTSTCVLAAFSIPCMTDFYGMSGKERKAIIVDYIDNFSENIDDLAEVYLDQGMGLGEAREKARTDYVSMLDKMIKIKNELGNHKVELHSLEEDDKDDDD